MAHPASFRSFVRFRTWTAWGSGAFGARRGSWAAGPISVLSPPAAERVTPPARPGRARFRRFCTGRPYSARVILPPGTPARGGRCPCFEGHGGASVHVRRVGRGEARSCRAPPSACACPEARDVVGVVSTVRRSSQPASAELLARPGLAHVLEHLALAVAGEQPSPGENVLLGCR